MKLKIPDEKNPDNPPKVITDPPKIREHMTSHYQKIFKKQDPNRNLKVPNRQFEQADSPLGCLLFEMASAFPEMILFNRKGKFLALLKKKSMGK